MKDYKFKFSVIMAVYNVEQYLAEAVESIIGQTIGIKNIQLILVDDGTPDNSGEICDEYAAKYPDNIFVIHKQNGGVSSARNAGLELAEGKYLSFIDSDDMWSKKTFKYVWDFFEAHDDIDVVATPLYYFEGRKGQHVLNAKFSKGTRVVDLKEEWETIHMNVSSAFFKSAAFKGVKFDTRLCYAEDAKAAHEVLFKKQRLGLVAEAQYMYRVRKSGAASAIQSSVERENWYLPVMENFYLDIIKKAQDTLGYIPKQLQMCLMYDLQWRIRIPTIKDNTVLNEEDKQKYLAYIKKMLTYIDDDVISAQKNIGGEHKIHLLRLKHSAPPVIEVEEKDVFCSFSEASRFSLANSRTKIDFISVKNNRLKIEGWVGVYNLEYDQMDISVYVDGERVPTQVADRHNSVYSLDNELLKRIGFCAELELGKKPQKIQIGAVVNGKLIFLQKMFYGYFAPIVGESRFAYYATKGHIIRGRKNHISVSPKSLAAYCRAELLFLLWLARRNRNGSRTKLFLRMWYGIRKRFKRRPIWLISDRPQSGGDNGEAFFRYMVKEHPEINARFVINGDCPDYSRLKNIGPVLKKGSCKHSLYTLLSDCILSSQGENEHFDPFGRARSVFKDIMANRPFVFIQHGVIKNDLSGWLNRFNKNIFGFITSAERERASILQGYDYSPQEVWLTGLPRFDRLYEDSKRLITLMPTWRKYLTEGWNADAASWDIAEDFTESRFYEFYNGLLSDERVLSAAKKYDYRLRLVLHPNLRAAAPLFKENDIVSVADNSASYSEIYAQSDLILTDYSSAVFDFAYMRKPIIYTHFDYEDFFSGNHSLSEGYFDDRRDGFGEVEIDLEGTVNRLVEYMQSGCQLKEKYRKRIDDFFAFSDQNNSERVYQRTIEALKK